MRYKDCVEKENKRGLGFYLREMLAKLSYIAFRYLIAPKALGFVEISWNAVTSRLLW